MAKIDLHVHSKYSEHPSDWFLQRLGAKESYTEPEYIYELAKKRGMDFITVTDHNRIEGALRLKEKHPEETFIGVESTTYFPEDGCKIHILFYGISEEQFEEIQEIRKNIFHLREYARQKDIVYSVAHATFSVNNRLTYKHIEQLILLFDVFEGINGGRTFLSNHQCMEIMKNLNQEHIERLQDKYNIEPLSKTPWIKSFTAGSDDHSGLFVGQTYTLTEAHNIEQVLQNIKNQKTSPLGRHNDYKSLAFTVYKIAYDFSRSKQNNFANSIASQITENIFESKPFDFKQKLHLRRIKSMKKKKENRIAHLLVELIEEAKKINPLDIDERLGIVYEKTSEIADEYFRKVLESMEKDLTQGDLVKFIMNFSASIPGIFLSLPFFSALKYMFHGRNIIPELKKSLGFPRDNGDQKILWFTDTINDSNDISESIRELSWILFRDGNKVRFVTSLENKEIENELPPNFIYLPHIFHTKIPYIEDFLLYFPSLLKSLKIIETEEPTEIYISTPGPIGLLGILFSRLVNVRCTGVFHRDLMLRVKEDSEDASLDQIVKSYSRWFYSMMDVIKVSSPEYIDLLEERGLDRNKMDLLHSGMGSNTFSFH
jgi:hypothetical protein